MLAGYANVNPAITPSDITPQNRSSPGAIARMSRPIMSVLMTAAMAAIIVFILMNSGRNVLRTFCQYVPPIIRFMNSDWKIRRPKRNPAMYSTIRSIHIGNPSVAVMTAAKMMPVASPATQWMVLPTPCFHSGRTNSSWVPGWGSLSAKMYRSRPRGPM